MYLPANQALEQHARSHDVAITDDILEKFVVVRTSLLWLRLDRQVSPQKA